MEKLRPLSDEVPKASFVPTPEQLEVIEETDLRAQDCYQRMMILIQPRGIRKIAKYRFQKSLVAEYTREDEPDFVFFKAWVEADSDGDAQLKIQRMHDFKGNTREAKSPCTRAFTLGESMPADSYSVARFTVDEELARVKEVQATLSLIEAEHVKASNRGLLSLFAKPAQVPTEVQNI